MSDERLSRMETKLDKLSEAVVEAMDSFTCHTCNRDLSAIAKTESGVRI